LSVTLSRARRIGFALLLLELTGVLLKKMIGLEDARADGVWWKLAE
jgi:hypothetical protein